ncbi:unnamed protein product [Allacma fusca]|uniref:DUF5641 domain-containing protein n=1 Tax=Allacma fusca TaxID=39272 RepID=A0A8J2NNY2_9HEXA|nr:unnamed protein product [Allacma fusca]
MEESGSHVMKSRRIQKITQHFWKRWSNEYLTRLQQRPKWLAMKPALQIGDLVLVQDDRLPPLKWKLARIVESHPGADGIARVYTIKTSDGIYKRPLVKLSPLPMDQ